MAIRAQLYLALRLFPLLPFLLAKGSGVAFIGWIICMCAMLGGLALKQDVPISHAEEIANGLLFAAFLACPGFWKDAPFGIGRKPRVMACVAMIFALPLVLMRP